MGCIVFVPNLRIKRCANLLEHRSCAQGRTLSLATSWQCFCLPKSRIYPHPAPIPRPWDGGRSSVSKFELLSRGCAPLEQSTSTSRRVGAAGRFTRGTVQSTLAEPERVGYLQRGLSCNEMPLEHNP
eukprot:2610182-Amphidinium_carterae.2